MHPPTREGKGPAAVFRSAGTKRQGRPAEGVAAAAAPRPGRCSRVGRQRRRACTCGARFAPR
eukprot:1356780-Lingulodinium_polyedra.AAC.1